MNAPGYAATNSQRAGYKARQRPPRHRLETVLGTMSLYAVLAIALLSPWVASAPRAQPPSTSAARTDPLIRNAVVNALLHAHEVHFWERRRFPLRFLLITEPHSDDAECVNSWQREAATVIGDLNHDEEIVRGVGPHEEFDLLIIVGAKARYDAIIRPLKDASAHAAALRSMYEMNDRIEKDFVRVLGDNSFARYGLAFIDAERSRSRWKADCEYASVRDLLVIQLFAEVGAILLISDKQPSGYLSHEALLRSSVILMKDAMYPRNVQQPTTKEEIFEQLKK